MIQTTRARLVHHVRIERSNADKTSPADAPLRQSIEVRVMVFDTEKWARFCSSASYFIVVVSPQSFESTMTIGGSVLAY